MNLKAAHLIAIQFGIFVGVVACLVFFHFEDAEPRTAAEIRERATEIAAAVKSLSEPDDHRADTADSAADSETAQLAPGQLAPSVPSEYSPEAVEQYRALATKLYYEQIAPRRNAGASLTHSSTVAVAPDPTEVAPQPAVVASYEPAPEPVAYVEPTQVVVYQPVQYIAYSHPRRFANRCRPAPHHNEFASNRHRHSDRGGIHSSRSPRFESPASPRDCGAALRRPASSIGVVQRRNTGAPSCPPIQGFRPRGKR